MRCTNGVGFLNQVNTEHLQATSVNLMRSVEALSLASGLP